jgi:hypothetical protein
VSHFLHHDDTAPIQIHFYQDGVNQDSVECRPVFDYYRRRDYGHIAGFVLCVFRDRLVADDSCCTPWVLSTLKNVLYRRDNTAEKCCTLFDDDIYLVQLIS